MSDKKVKSIKIRITLWYFAFIVIICVFLIGALLISQNVFSNDFYVDQLNYAIDTTVSKIKTEADFTQIELHFDTGVRVSVLSEDGQLIIGQKKFDAAFKEKSVRLRKGSGGHFWYLLDKAIALEEGKVVWIRAYISSAVSKRVNRSLLTALIIIMPVLLISAILGGIMLTRRAFAQLDEMIETAQRVSGSTDLNRKFRTETQEEEVARLADSFDAMLARLRNSIEEEKAFISDASHELRTPLSVIQVQSEFALNEGRSIAEKDEALRIIHDRSARAGQMISQMLMLSRMDSNRMPMQIECICLSELLLQIASEMKQSAGEKDIKMETAIEEDVYYSCDELLMIRMVTNLIENAIRYGKKNGYVLLGLVSNEKDVEVTVEDDGIGISDQDIGKIYRRFYQVEKSGDESPGVGLGLSIVKRIAEAHGAELNVESRMGKGTRFTIRFPK